MRQPAQAHSYFLNLILYRKRKQKHSTKKEDIDPCFAVKHAMVVCCKTCNALRSLRDKFGFFLVIFISAICSLTSSR